MRVLSWNVNGLSTVLNYEPFCKVPSYKIDISKINNTQTYIFSFQEVRCQKAKLPVEMAVVKGYDGYFSCSRARLGYSGVCVYVKSEVGLPTRTSERITEGLELLLETPYEILDSEGRCLILEFGNAVLVNLYLPYLGKQSPKTFVADYYACVRARVDEWLNAGRDLILVGDMNAVHQRIDHASPNEGLGPGQDFKDFINRRWLDDLLFPHGPLVDSGRLHHPRRKGMYTCWDARKRARRGNLGVRVDYILHSPWIFSSRADTLPHILGSDHCPIYADVTLSLTTSVLPTALLTTQWAQFKTQKDILHYFVSTRTDSPSLADPTSPRPTHQILRQTLLNPIHPPLCEAHLEPCLEMRVLRRGKNQGRVFYICSRPVGPRKTNQEKEIYQCKHFSWKY